MASPTVRFVAAFLCCAFVVAVSVVSFGAGATHQDRKAPQSSRVEYTVASNSAAGAAEAGSPGGGRVAVPTRRDPGTLPETLTLVVVGSMLIGLAAAVRRTT